MKALVVSGGGAKGAFAGGLIQALGDDYELFVGTSTGSLIIPLVASEEFEQLKSAYTNINQKTIFKVNPFKVDKDDDIDLNWINIIYNILIRGKKSFGDSSNLRKNIDKFITIDVFNSIKNSDKDVLICVTNVNLGVSEYKSIRDVSFEDFKDWMWASTSAFPFMGAVVKNGYEYVDGGFTDPCPIQEAINRGATEIDVVVLRPENGEIGNVGLKNPLQGIGRMIDVMLKEINKDDIKIASLNAKDLDVRLNVYFTPRVLTTNPLVFNKEQMTKWWDEGFNYGKTKPNTIFIVKKVGEENICLGRFRD